MEGANHTLISFSLLQANLQLLSKQQELLHQEFQQENFILAMNGA
jgi:hypothetical protein